MISAKIKKLTNKILKKFNHILVDYSDFNHLKKSQAFEEFFTTLATLNNADLTQTFHFLSQSQSQLKQDLFVLNCLGFKKNGYFVEFGATNGVDLSNSWLLEKKFNWNGILAEPARIWHENLHKNRKCHIETQCVWRTTGESLEFNEVEGSEFSTIADFSNSDHHHKTRNQGIKYPVNTISLDDLLEKYNAPTDIDYLSIDTEGSEFDILEKFSFQKYKIKIITVEHNYTQAREQLYTLLSRNGYKRIFESLSLWDDWYILESEI